MPQSVQYQSDADRIDPFDRLIGQKRVIPFLKEIRDGFAYGSSVSHPLLFLGRPGVGKTSVSRAFAESIGAEFVRIDCGPELKSEHLVERLVAINNFTNYAVVLADELHSLRRPVQEILFNVLDAHTVPPLDRGRLDRCAKPIAITPFILVGATNQPGKLLPALRSRMISVAMEEYTADELHEIVRQKATRFHLRLTDEAADLVVRACGGSPRSIVQILQAVDSTSAAWRFRQNSSGRSPHDVHATADYPNKGGSTLLDSALADAVADGRCTAPGNADAPHASDCAPYIPDEFVRRALGWMGLDDAGLDATGRTLLTTIRQHGRATAELLATVVGLDMAYTRENLAELRARQLVHAAPGRGWVLTAGGQATIDGLAEGFTVAPPRT